MIEGLPDFVQGRQRRRPEGEYSATFIGKGFLAGDGEVEFISDRAQSGGEDYDEVVPERHQFHLEDMFPMGWWGSGHEVRFKITVEAERVSADAPKYSPSKEKIKRDQVESTRRATKARHEAYEQTMPGYGGRPIPSIIVGKDESITSQ